jgi:hypothetical protein
MKQIAHLQGDGVESVEGSLTVETGARVSSSQSTALDGANTTHGIFQ